MTFESQTYVNKKYVSFVYIQRAIEIDQKGALKKKIDCPASVTPWASLFYIFSPDLFHVKRPQVPIKTKIIPITSCSL